MNRIIFSLLFVASVLLGMPRTEAGEEKLKVLCTTFPVYQIARNVVKDKPNVELQLMLPAAMGCPHDYALTPQDMQKLASAKVLIINGLGMEEFLGAPIKKANKNIEIVDSSTGIKETLDYPHDGDDHDEDNDHHAKHHDEKEHEHHDAEHDDDHDEEHHGEHHHHHHEGTNPHLFASPAMAAKMAMNIAAGLSKVDVQGAGTYFQNASEYSKVLMKLNDEFVTAGKKLKNNRIIEPHGVFDYLARDMGLEIVAVLQAHGQEPSAAKMLEIVKIVKNKKPGAIFTEPQYPEKSARTLAKETGLPVAQLDPVASGPADAPMDYYQQIMRKNLKTLIDTLGVK